MKTIWISLVMMIISSSAAFANTKDRVFECKYMNEAATEIMMADIQKETESVVADSGFSNVIRERLSAWMMMDSIQKETESIGKRLELTDVITQKLAKDSDVTPEIAHK